jgi:phosphoribosylformylglycinamidine synthase
LIDPVAGSNCVAEALSNCLGTYQNGMEGLSLSANWMWACKNGEDARLYAAVESSNFAIELGINIQREKIHFR